MKKLDDMLNIGKEMKSKLFTIGISTPEELIRLGSKEVFVQLKEQYPNVCLVHLYVLEGAIHNIKYDSLSDEMKLDLKQFNDNLK